jgi:very-short-patch-repair endonuclease
MKASLTRRARELRKNSTAAERLLWNSLRAGQVAGLKFRRQQPVGHYVVDFFCASKRLVIELDGQSHEDKAHYDASRQHYLESQGLQVIRFYNDEILNDMGGVLEKILAFCAELSSQD